MRARRSNVTGALIALALTLACTRASTGKEGAMNGDPSKGGSSTPAQTLTLSSSLNGTTLHVVLTNGGGTPLKALTHVEAGGRVDLDWFTVSVKIGGASRDLRFTGPRDRSARVTETLAAGGTTARDVDLAWWAQQPINGGKALPTGKGTLTVVYEVANETGVWNGRIEAKPIDVSW